MLPVRFRWPTVRRQVDSPQCDGYRQPIRALRRGVWSRPQPTRDEGHAESVVVAVAKAAGDAPVELDQSVDGFGAAVAPTVGVEVAEERLPPLPRGAPEPCDLRDRRGRQAGEHGLGETSSGRVGAPGWKQARICWAQ